MSDSQRRIFNGWLVEAHDHCTCEGEFGHPQEDSWWVPLVHLRDLDGWDKLEAEVTAGVVAEVKRLRETYGLDAEDQHPCVRVEAYMRMVKELLINLSALATALATVSARRVEAAAMVLLRRAGWHDDWFPSHRLQAIEDVEAVLTSLGVPYEQQGGAT